MAELDGAFRGTDLKAVKMSRFLLKNDGLFVGSSSAMNYVGAVRVVQSLGPGHIIVTILCDDGMRHLSKFHNAQYLSQHGLTPTANGLEFLGLRSRPNHQIHLPCPNYSLNIWMLLTVATHNAHLSRVSREIICNPQTPVLEPSAGMKTESSNSISSSASIQGFDICDDATNPMNNSTELVCPNFEQVCQAESSESFQYSVSAASSLHSEMLGVNSRKQMDSVIDLWCVQAAPANIPAAYLSANMEWTEQQDIFRELCLDNCRYKLLYVTPEKVAKSLKAGNKNVTWWQQ